MKRTEVLMFGLSSYPGGIENAIMNVLCHERFPEDQIHVSLVTYEPAIAFEETILAKGHHVLRVPHLKKDPFGYARAIRKRMLAQRFDVVYVNMLTAANVLPILGAKAAGIQSIVLHAHASSTVKGSFRHILHRMNRGYCVRNASLRLACSAAAGQWLYGDCDFTIVPNTIDCRRFKPSEESRAFIRKTYGIDEKTLLIGHVGRFAPEKNHAFMLDIIDCILRKGIRAKILFVGDGILKSSIQQKAHAMGLSEQTIFVPTTSEVEKIYPAFDVFLFPSSYEGFGMAMLEAQSCGVPCVCSDMVSEAVDATKTTRYISLKKTPAHWADIILQDIAVDKDMLHRRICASDYNAETQIDKYISFLRGKEPEYE